MYNICDRAIFPETGINTESSQVRCLVRVIVKRPPVLLFANRFFGCSDGMEREACVCDHGYERSDLCAEIIIIIIIIITVQNSRSTPVAQLAPRNLLTRWDVSSTPANGIFLTKN